MKLNHSEDPSLEDWLDHEDLPITIWKNKYQNGDESFSEWLDRVSAGNRGIRRLILDKKFIFAGRILSNRGVKDRKITYSNCYVVPPCEDSIESIFEAGAKLARTFSYGGGCGIDISNLRPRNSPVHNAAKTTSGAVSFMDLYSFITGLIGQEGRRGALMISISCEHPDLEEFINLKSNLDVCTKANISVRVTDAFMQAVKNDENFKLHFTMEDGSEITKTINARDTFMLLAKRNWEMAEPGILYWDRISNYNLLQNTGFKFAGVNPCAEQALPAGGSCLLCSINLSEFVKNPFTPEASVDYSELVLTVFQAVKALNEVLLEGISLHPLKEQREIANNWRQIGLGTMGLADMLIKLGVRYGSKQSLEIINTVYKVIAVNALNASSFLVEKYGTFPKCSEEVKGAIVSSEFIANLELHPEMWRSIKENGLCNSQLLTCAPTGSIGTMFQVSTGIEPNFAFSYNRRTLSLNNKETSYKVDAKIVKEYRKATGNTSLPDYFVSADQIHYKDRIAVQSALQRYIDASISSTVNLPNSTTIEEVADLYMLAWESGLKGVTIWRDGCQRQAILSADTKSDTKDDTKGETKGDTKNENIPVQTDGPKYNSIIPVSRKEIGVTTGATYCKKCACGTLYITVNRDKEGNLVEIFTHTSKGGICAANTNGLTRMISLAMRSGVCIKEIKDQLRGINCPACLKLKAQGRALDGISCPDILSKTIEEFMDTNTPTTTYVEHPIKSVEGVSDGVGESVCPECGFPIEHQSGCRSCSNCGWSKCG